MNDQTIIAYSKSLDEKYRTADATPQFLVLQNYFDDENDQYDFMQKLADRGINPKAHVDGRVYFNNNGDLHRAVRVLDEMGVS